MTTELYRDQFGVITHDAKQGVLELTWFETTESMSDQDFKVWLQRYAELGEAHRPAFMVIDAQAFRHRFSAELAAWRDQHIIPRYNAAGVSKLAFLLPKQALPSTPPTTEGAANFPTGYFDTRKGMTAWFGS